MAFEQVGAPHIASHAATPDPRGLSVHFCTSKVLPGQEEMP